MNWTSIGGRILLIAALAGLLGWLYGYALEAVALALLGVIVFWLVQMLRVQKWLQEPSSPPPDVFGIWGELIARIYAHQRRDKIIQQRLQSNVDYLQNSFTSMRDGVIMVDNQASIKWFNGAIQPLLDLRYPEDVGQTLTNLVRVPEFNAYFLSGDYQEPLQYSTGGDNQSHLRVEITHFGEGERLLFVRDISAAVRMEQIRRDFVGNVSHELRTPLTVISGYLGAFLATPQDLPERYLKPLEQMSQYADRMENLLKDLLWLSRIESEKSEAKRELVDVGMLLQELRDELLESHPASVIELKLDSNTKVHGDYRELYSAVSNLLLNAIKYCDEQCPIIVSWYERRDNCALEVRDQGIGIDSVLIPRLTERFFRVDDSRNSKTGGTGLGLAIVKHVAEAHGAQLKIDSELGVGSTFTLLFPVGG